MAAITVGEAMSAPPAAVAPQAPLSVLIERFTSGGMDSLPVIGPQGGLLGIAGAAQP